MAEKGKEEKFLNYFLLDFTKTQETSADTITKIAAPAIRGE